MPRGDGAKIKYLLSDECERTWSREQKYEWRQKLCAMEERLKKPDHVRARARKSGNKVKLEVLAHYGPNDSPVCSWEGCAVTDIDMLTLDHINNDGGGRRGDGGRRDTSGFGKYFQVRKAGFPEGFQTLCMNHQFKKELMRKRAATEARRLERLPSAQKVEKESQDD